MVFRLVLLSLRFYPHQLPSFNIIYMLEKNSKSVYAVYINFEKVTHLQLCNEIFEYALG